LFTYFESVFFPLHVLDILCTFIVDGHPMHCRTITRCQSAATLAVAVLAWNFFFLGGMAPWRP